MRGLRFTVTGVALAFCLSVVAVSQSVPPFQFLQKPGPHAVGLKVVEQYDYSRTFRSTIDELGKPYKGNERGRCRR